ncbi:SapC family protein [Thalassotalea sp. M1531]|uniref:SapC family protein n=1 Tax=Thalassotalea algicola TaxID=2716224 RepID=A0A7Y0LCD7_9GAMM|nr:SapC family protein [Thalassotalea algicola]NMP31512.1 SapC family protein [Thalassotalea algicola]
MANHELLNNVEHKDLKINTEKSAKFGNNKTYSLLYPFEYKHAQADYPIFFLKDQNDAYSSIALFGFEQNENLFLTDQGWQASYVPLMVEREPFLIGFQTNEQNEQSPVVHIDMDSPRVNTETGVEVFLPHGGNSEYINRISTILKTIHDSKATTQKFMETVQELDLLEPFNLDIQLNDGSNNRLSGFYTINEDKLAQLDGEQLASLNKSGLLNLIYMVIASHANVTALIQRKEQRTFR